MPTLKLTNDFVLKLKSFGVYDKWKSNLITQWDHSKNISGALYPVGKIQSCIDDDLFQSFINASFFFSKTPEGNAFWWTIK